MSGAEQEAKKLVASTQKEAVENAQKKLDKPQLKKIIDEILLSEFKGA